MRAQVKNLKSLELTKWSDFARNPLKRKTAWRNRSMPTHSERFNPPTFESKIGLKTAWKTEHIRSISPKTPKKPEKTEHCRSPVARVVFLMPKSHRKRSIAVHLEKHELLLSSDLRLKNGANPFTFSVKCQFAFRKRSIAVHFSALFYVICM